MWDLQYVYELPTSALLTDASGSSSSRELLPTPSAYESTPTDECTAEVREHMADPHERLYLPGRKWHAQRTLSRIAPALLPTPGANDSTGSEGPTRDARRESGRTGGPSLRDVEHLLPTPRAMSDRSSRKSMVENRQWSAPSLEQAVEIARGELPREFESWDELAGELGRTARESLLPTPTTQDAKNTAGPSQFERNSDPLNVAVTKLLPTPVAVQGRRSTAEKPEWTSHSGTTLTDAIWEVEGRTEDTTGKPLPGKLLPTPTAADGDRVSEQGPRYYAGQGDNPTLLGAALRVTGEAKLLPTPQSSDGDGGRMETTAMRAGGIRPSGAKATLTLRTAIDLSGEPTSLRFDGGNGSSDGPHPDQLTIEDA